MLLAIVQLAIAQAHKCRQPSVIQNRIAGLPGYEAAIAKTFDTARNNSFQKANSRSKQVFTVPVVVHVVYNTGVQNISDELIHSQIDVLNKDFQRLNSDAGDARALFQEVAGNAEIQFVLADTNPEGNPTTGITRTETDVETFMDVAISFESIFSATDSCGVDLADPATLSCIMEQILGGALEDGAEENGSLPMDNVKSSAKGGKDPWNTERYINLWVCNLNMNFQGQEIPAVMGFAYPPTEAPYWPERAIPTNIKAVDGVVVHHEAFGVDNPNAGQVGDLFNKGRTCTHEMGHYFGLRHISGDGDCDSDDGITDTPSEVASQSAGDPANQPSCEELHSLDTCPADDLPDMYENFMSYNPEACQNLFTKEQVGIIRAMLEGPRSGLILQQLTNTHSTELDQALTIFPNPTNGQLNIQLIGYDLKEFDVNIQNIMGQEVLSIPATKAIDMSTLEAGVYLVRLGNDKFSTTRKVSVL